MQNLLRSIDRTEKKFILFIIGLLLAITVIPYLAGFILAGDDQVFTGINYLTPGDIPVYYSYLEQAKSGQVLFQNLFTGENQSPHLFNPLWLVGGVIASLFSLSSVITFQLLRILLIPLFVWIAYLLVSYLVEDKGIRKTALVFTVFSTGISAYFIPWLDKIFYRAGDYLHFPMDLWVPESNTFLTLFHNPLFILATTLLILTFLYWLLAIDRRKIKYTLFSGLACLGLVLLHPFMLVVVVAVIVVFLFARQIIGHKFNWREWYYFLLVLLVSSPSIIYYLYLLSQHQVFQAKSGQNTNYTPVWWMIFFSYGFLIILFLINLAANRQNRQTKYLFINIWFLVQLALLWSPLYYQRRLAEGLHLPLSYLAVLGLWVIYQRIQKLDNKSFCKQMAKQKVVLIFAFIIFFGFSNVLAVAQEFKNYLIKDRYYVYQSSEAFGLYDWLKANTNSSAVILAPAYQHNLIPGFTGRFSYWGHGVETLDFLNKYQLATEFYQSSDQDWRYQFLADSGIDYVVIDKQKEPELTWSDSNLDLVFTNSQFLVYRFREE
ncbi:hypothetical protein KKI23_01155 [Patescibacteria group bacterium]|nr:hypothetical protein [Patescibacteria group bacterium]